MKTDLQARIADATKSAMRNRERRLVAALRLVKAELQQAEVEARESLDDGQVVAILNRMIKQRRTSAEQYLQANRTDLADQEKYEIDIIQTFTPSQLGDEELRQAIEEVCGGLAAVDMKHMGPVMKQLTSDLAGRADMSRVGVLVRERLSG